MIHNFTTRRQKSKLVFFLALVAPSIMVFSRFRISFKNRVLNLLWLTHTVFFLALVAPSIEDVSRFRISFTQCAPEVFNLDKKVQGWNFFSYLLWCKTSQNQSRKTSVIRLPFELPVNQCQPSGPGWQIVQHWLAGSSEGSLITDVFLDWFWLVLHHSN